MSLTLLLALLPGLLCPFNGFEYNSPYPDRCCDGNFETEFQIFAKKMGLEFAIRHVRPITNVPNCEQAFWVVDASVDGWVFAIEMLQEFPEHIVDNCDWGLKKWSTEEFPYGERDLHAYKSLVQSERLDELASCACGESYGFPKTLKFGVVKCNGDYTVGSNYMSREDWSDNAKYSEFANRLPESRDFEKKVPRHIDLERGIFYCDTNPYTQRGFVEGGPDCGPPNPNPKRCDPSSGCGAFSYSGGWWCPVFVFLFVRISGRKCCHKRGAP